MNGNEDNRCGCILSNDMLQFFGCDASLAAFKNSVLFDHCHKGIAILGHGLPDRKLFHSGVTSSVKPSSIHPVIPPAMILAGSPSSARRNAPRAAPLQCGPAQ